MQKWKGHRARKFDSSHHLCVVVSSHFFVVVYFRLQVEQHAAHWRQCEIFFLTCFLFFYSNLIFIEIKTNQFDPCVCVPCTCDDNDADLFFFFDIKKEKRKEEGRGFFILRVFARLSEFDACTTRNNKLLSLSSFSHYTMSFDFEYILLLDHSRLHTKSPIFLCCKEICPSHFFFVFSPQILKGRSTSTQKSSIITPTKFIRICFVPRI